MEKITEGAKVTIKGQKGRHVYMVDMVAPVSGLASLKGFKRIVDIKRLQLV